MYTLNQVSSHPFSRRITWSWSESGQFNGSNSQSGGTTYRTRRGRGQSRQSNSGSSSGSWSKSYESIENCYGTTIMYTDAWASAEASDSGNSPNSDPQDNKYSTSGSYETKETTIITVSQAETTATASTTRDGYSQDSTMISGGDTEYTFVKADGTVRAFTTTDVSGLTTLTTKGVTTENLQVSWIESLSTVGATDPVPLEDLTTITNETSSVDYAGDYDYTVYAEKGERLVSFTEGGLKVKELLADTVSELAIKLTYLSRERSTSLRVLDQAASFQYTASESFTVGFSTSYEYTYISNVPSPEFTIKSHTKTYVEFEDEFELPMISTTSQRLEYVGSKTAKSTVTIRHGMVQDLEEEEEVWRFPTVTADYGKVDLTETSFYELPEWGTAYTFNEFSGSTTISMVIGTKRVSYSWTTWEDIIQLFASNATFEVDIIDNTSGSFEGTFDDEDFGLRNPYTVRSAYGATIKGKSNWARKEGFTEVTTNQTMVTAPFVYFTPAIIRSHVYEVGLVGKGTDVRGLIYTGVTIGGTYNQDGEQTRPEEPKLVRVRLGLSSLKPKTDKYVTISHLSITFRPDITAPTSKSNYASLTSETSSSSVGLEGNVNSSFTFAPNLSEGDPKGGTFLWNVNAGHYTNVDGQGKLVKEFAAKSKDISAQPTAYLPLPCLSGVQVVAERYSTSVAVHVLPAVATIAEQDKV